MSYLNFFNIIHNRVKKNDISTVLKECHKGSSKIRVLNLANLDFYDRSKSLDLIKDLYNFLGFDESQHFHMYDYFEDVMPCDHNKSAVKLRITRKTFYLSNKPQDETCIEWKHFLVEEMFDLGSAMRKHMEQIKAIFSSQIDSIIKEGAINPPQYCGYLCTRDIDNYKFWHFDLSDYSLLVSSIQELYVFCEILKLSKYDPKDCFKKCKCCEQYYFRILNSSNNSYCSQKCKTDFNNKFRD